MEADTSHTMEQKTKTQVSSGLQNEKTYIFFFFHLIHGQNLCRSFIYKPIYVLPLLVAGFTWLC